MENLVPLDVYDAAIQQISLKERRLPILKELRRLGDHHRAHLDFKDGLTLYEIEHGADAVARDFWSEVSVSLDRHHCQRPEYPCQKRDECSCQVIHGLGSNVIEQVVEWLRREGHRNPQEVARLFDLHGNAKLAGLCDEIIAWCCALPEKLS